MTIVSTDFIQNNLIGTMAVIFFTFSIVLNLVLTSKIKTIKAVSPITMTFSEAAKVPGRPVATIVDQSGDMIAFPVETSNKNLGLIEDDEYVLVRPNVAKSSAKVRFPGMPDMIFYPLPGALPYGFHESAAIVQLAEKIRGNDELNWIQSEIDVIGLIFDDPSHLMDDCVTVVSVSVKSECVVPESFLQDGEEEITDDVITSIGEQLYDIIKEFQKEIDVTPIRFEPVCLSEAARLCSVGVTGNVVSSLLSIQEQVDRAEKLDFFDKHKDLIIIALGIFAIPILYYVVMHYIG